MFTDCEIEEEWVVVRGFDSHMISNLGRVCNWKSGTLLRPRPSGWGYLQVVLYRNGRTHTKSIHKMVAEAFVPGWDTGLEVNHIDGDKTNNVETNLEWVTKSMNNTHAIRTGLRKPRGTAVEIVETGERFESVKSCAEFLNVWPTEIVSVAKGRRPRVKGYRIRYVER